MSNILKGSGIIYTNGIPNYTPNSTYDSEVALDITNGNEYIWNRGSVKWDNIGQRIEIATSSAFPTHTPTNFRPRLVLTPDRNLYFYSGSWALANPTGSSVTLPSGLISSSAQIGFTGIYSGSGTVPSGTSAQMQIDVDYWGGDCRNWWRFNSQSYYDANISLNDTRFFGFDQAVPEANRYIRAGIYNNQTAAFQINANYPADDATAGFLIAPDQVDIHTQNDVSNAFSAVDMDITHARLRHSSDGSHISEIYIGDGNTTASGRATGFEAILELAAVDGYAILSANSSGGSGIFRRIQMSDNIIDIRVQEGANSTYLDVGNSQVLISTPNGSVVYEDDYSGNYTNRSLIDKQFFGETGITTATTDATGNVAFEWGQGYGTFASCTVWDGGLAAWGTVVFVDGTDVQFRFYDKTGAALVSSLVKFSWHVK